MSKSFKIDPDTREETQKVLKYGNNVRKVQAKKKVLERRKQRHFKHQVEENDRQ